VAKHALISSLILLLCGCTAVPFLDSLNCEAARPPDVNVRDVGSDELYQQLKDVPRSNKERAAKLVDLFEDVGCQGDSLKTEKFRSSRLPNIVCELEGLSNSTIVIGAHYDKTPRSRGVVDNWTGVSLLPLLYQHLKEQSPQHTFQFIGFAEEELNLVGSKSYVRSLSAASLERIVAMINLDTFGLTTVMVDPRSEPHLACRLFATAEWLQLPLQVAKVTRPITGDWEPFRSRGVAILNLHSINRSGLNIVHTGRDRLETVDQGHYFDTYRLIQGFLIWLDATLPTGGSR